jgi:UDP-4-amino-4,6-dideoxy-N-acetyl-beta-L-altrosamine transaminase
MIPYSRQCIDDDDVRAVAEALCSDFLTQGPRVMEFEQALAEYSGASYAVVLSSGTAALHAAYSAAGIGSNDEVITSPITFASTANAALLLGARPVFVDVEADTGNIDASLIEAAITEKTKAIVPIDYGGHPTDMDVIHEVAARHGIIVIEDACHALGAEYKGRKVGSLHSPLLKMSVFSFHALKPITTGEGGAVLTDDEEFYKKLLAFRSHGIIKDNNNSDEAWRYDMKALGVNYRMTDFQAALGLSQLKKLASFIKRRREVAAIYNEEFAGNDFFDLPVEKDYASSGWHLYSVRLKGTALNNDNKVRLFDELREAGLWVQVHYLPVYLLSYYKELGYEEGLCPVAEAFYKSELSLPLYHGMTDKDVETVIKTVNKVFKGFR